MDEDNLDHFFMLLQFGTKVEQAQAKEQLEAMGFWNDEIPEILNLDSSIESSKES
jgi:hypothetical protein